jgi:hypothetical protein
MITYWYQIDPYNHIEGTDNGEIYSVTNVKDHLKHMGWKSNKIDEESLPYKKLAQIFAQRNFFRYELRQRKYGRGGYDGIFPF